MTIPFTHDQGRPTMKSERRHELTTNALADWLAGIIERIRPYQTTLLGVVLLAVLLIAVADAVVRTASPEQTAAILARPV